MQKYHLQTNGKEALTSILIWKLGGLTTLTKIIMNTPTSAHTKSTHILDRLNWNQQVDEFLLGVLQQPCPSLVSLDQVEMVD